MNARLRRNAFVVPWLLLALMDLALAIAFVIKHEWTSSINHLTIAVFAVLIAFLLYVIRANREDIKTLRAHAWDEGYYRGVRDELLDIQHRADNPYLTESGAS